MRVLILLSGSSPLSILMEVDVNGKQHAIQWLTRCGSHLALKAGAVFWDAPRIHFCSWSLADSGLMLGLRAWLAFALPPWKMSLNSFR